MFSPLHILKGENYLSTAIHQKTKKLKLINDTEAL